MVVYANSERKTYENSNAAKAHGEDEGTPVAFPGETVDVIAFPCLRLVRAHAVGE